MAKFGRPYYKMVRIYDEPNDYFYIKNNGTGNFRVRIQKSGGNYVPKCIEYSYDLVTWQKVATSDSNYVDLQTSNEKIYLRSTGGTESISSTNYLMIEPQSQNLCIGGNLATLIDWQNKDAVYNLPDFCFYSLFASNANFYTSTENLTFGNIKHIGRYACDGMFKNTKITSAPDMSSIETVDWQGLHQAFYTCYDLTTSPDLSSLTTVEWRGLDEAFYACTEITSANLSSLTTVGEKGLYRTFYQCTNMTTGADLSSVVTIGSNGMSNLYVNCSKLDTVTAPNLLTWDTSVMSGWLYGAGGQATGTKTVYCPTGVTIPTGNTSGIPTGWTRVDY